MFFKKLREKLKEKRAAFAEKYPKTARVIRWIWRIVKWTLIAILALVLMLLLGLGGPLVKYVAIPIANGIGVPASVDTFSVHPLAGYVHIVNLKVENPTLFVEADKLYQEEPLFVLGELEVNVGMLSLLREEIVVDTVKVNGIHALYALDCKTTNVDALVEQITGPKEETSQEVVEEVHEEVQEERVEAAEEAAEEPKEKKELRFLIRHFEMQDNSVALRNANLVVPLYIPVKLPPMTFEDIDNKSLAEKLMPVYDSIYGAYQGAVEGLGKVGDLLGDGATEAGAILGDTFDATDEILGGTLTDSGDAIGDVLSNSGDALGDVFSGSGEALEDVGKDLSEGLSDLFKKKKSDK